MEASVKSASLLYILKTVLKNVYFALNITFQLNLVHSIAVADLGFPRGGGANSPGGAPTYEFAKFSQKLHEIERIWTPGGGARVQNFTM